MNNTTLPQMINGKFYLARTIEQANKLEGLGFKVLFAGEGSPIPPTYLRVPILLPPIDAVDANVSGDMGAFQNIYEYHLMFNEPVVSTIATILVALHNGVNLALYMEGEGLAHIEYFRIYMASMFGIVIGDEQVSFTYNPLFNISIASMLYAYQDGFITYPEFISTFPPNYMQVLSMPHLTIVGALEKLRCELNVPIELFQERVNGILANITRFNVKAPLIILEDKQNVGSAPQ